jgi:formylglycine-generating enzyme required for sulfatase activity
MGTSRTANIQNGGQARRLKSTKLFRNKVSTKALTERVMRYAFFILFFSLTTLAYGQTVKHPIPAEAELVGPRKVIDELFGEQLKAAKTYDEKIELSKQLLEIAQTAGDKWEQYALIQQAQKLAIEAKHPTQALHAADATAESFRVEKVDLRTKILVELFGEKAEEKTLRWLAETDAAAANDMNRCHLAAEAWYNLSKKVDGLLALSAKERSLHHYKTVLPKLAGLEKLQAEKRIKECEEAIKNRPTSSGRYGRGHITSVNCTKGLSTLKALKAQRGAALAYGVPVTFTNRAGMRFNFIPAGTFIMGLPPKAPHRNDSEKQREVKIQRPFYMSVTEVTQVQYWRVLKQKPSIRKDCLLCPVENVSWHDAKAFCLALTQTDKRYKYTLPTEEQWEYACRAGTLDDTYGPLHKIAWFKTNSKQPQTVGRLAPNAWGLYDCIGNLWEYTNTEAGNSVQIRGGCCTDKVGKGELRAGNRVVWPKEKPTAHLGLRVIIPL